MPKTLLVTDENDVLRDEGEAYAHKLMAAGVDITAIRILVKEAALPPPESSAILGTIHDFAILNGLSSTPAVSEVLNLITTAITNLRLHK